MPRLLHKFCIILFIPIFLIGIMTVGLLSAAGEKAKKPTGKNATAPKQEKAAEDEPFAIKVSVDLVTIDVSIIGTPTANFQPEDFVIYDNDVAQEASYFSQDQLPLAIALDIDASESIRSYLPMLQISAFTTLRRLKPEDQVSLHSFNSNRYRLCDLTEDRIEIAEKIGKIKIALGTNIYDSVYDATAYLRSKAPRRRRAVILVSDNCHVIIGGEAYHNKDGALSELLESNTLLYNIRTPGDSGGFFGCMEGDANIHRIADETGGLVIDVQDSSGIQPALEKVITHLRKQYTLGFNSTVPGEKGSYHKLAVKFNNEKICPGCRILSRKGYYSGVSQPLPSPEDLLSAKKKTIESPEKTDEVIIQRSILTAAAFNKDLPGIRFSVKDTQQVDANGQPQVKLDLSIPASGIRFKEVDSKRACKLRVAVFYATENGKILGSDWKKIDGLVGNETYNSLLQGGYNYSVVVPMKEATQMIKIVIFDENSDQIGTKILLVQQQTPS
jgi:VWFA-related protein